MNRRSLVLLFAIIGLMSTGCGKQPPEAVVESIRLKEYVVGRLQIVPGMVVDSIGVEFYMAGTVVSVLDSNLEANTLYDFVKRPKSVYSEIFITIPREATGSATVAVAKHSDKLCPEQWARDRLGKRCEVKEYPEISYP